MASYLITKSAQAYKGQSVICTFTEEDWINDILPNIKVKDPVGVDSSRKLGLVSEIDVYGFSIKVTPLQPDKRFDSNETPGILMNGDSVYPYEP